jgi:hypothetical protein
MTFEDTVVSHIFEKNNLSTNRQFSATFHKLINSQKSVSVRLIIIFNNFKYHQQ